MAFHQLGVTPSWATPSTRSPRAVRGEVGVTETTTTTTTTMAMAMLDRSDRSQVSLETPLTQHPPSATLP